MDFPNSISPEALESLLNEKGTDEVFSADEREVLDLVEAEVDKLFETLPDPLMHKLVILNLLSRLSKWHAIMAEKHLEQEPDVRTVALSWAADQGRLSTAHSIILDVRMGEHDFTTKQSDD